MLIPQLRKWNNEMNKHFSLPLAFLGLSFSIWVSFSPTWGTKTEPVPRASTNVSPGKEADLASASTSEPLAYELESCSNTQNCGAIGMQGRDH